MIVQEKVIRYESIDSLREKTKLGLKVNKAILDYVTDIDQVIDTIRDKKKNITYVVIKEFIDKHNLKELILTPREFINQMNYGDIYNLVDIETTLDENIKTILKVTLKKNG